MYEKILSRIFVHFGSNTIDEEIEFLTETQPTAKRLWESYQRQDVMVDYTDIRRQAVYLLRYYPGYSRLLERELNELHDKLTPGLLVHSDYAEALFFGAGPAPELYGLINYLSKRQPDIQMITTHLYDIATPAWAFSRDITINHLIPQVWQEKLLDAYCHEFDICDANVVNQLCRERVGSLDCHFVVFQNCLNELGQCPQTQANILTILRAMQHHSFLVIIDRAGYAHVLQLLQSIQSEVKQEGLGTPMLAENRGYHIDDLMPQQIKTHLFTRDSGLIPANSIRYHSLIVRRERQ